MGWWIGVTVDGPVYILFFFSRSVIIVAVIRMTGG